MNKIILSIILFGFSIGLNAQWTDNGTSLTTSDNIGIGTTNPSQKLDVLGNIYLNSVSASSANNQVNSSSMLFKSSGYATDNKTRYQLWQVLSIGKSIWGSGDLVFNSNTDGMGYNERVRFSANGNVGIGTNNPTHKFEVHSGSAGSDAPMFSMNSSDSGLTGVNSSLILRNTDLTNGNWSRFHFFNGNNSAGASIATQFKEHNSSNMTADLVFVTKGSGVYSEKVRITGSGQVGIGTINPDMKLTVKGNIHAEEVKIDLSVPAPDYVFKEDYNLRSIEEVENHIKEKGHLKDIPSAREVEENGVFLGEMDSKLLQKIEELTLYAIQQKKEIQKQEKEIEELKLLVGKLIESKK